MEPRNAFLSSNAHTPLGRRRVLTLLGAGGVALVVPRTASATVPGTSADVSSSSMGTVTAPDCSVNTPEETGGPFPSDGSNDNGAGATADVLHDPRAVRSDIRGDLDGNNVQEGVPLTLTLRVTKADGCTPLVGAAIYLWHATRDGHYSQYNSDMLGGDYSAFSYLRGVQVTDDNGTVTFTTVLPGRYQGRAFHIHYEVYDDAQYSNKLLTSQMGLPDDIVTALYTQIGETYAASLANDTSLADDMVFGDDDGVHQLMTVSGDAASGLVGACNVVV